MLSQSVRESNITDKNSFKQINKLRTVINSIERILDI